MAGAQGFIKNGCPAGELAQILKAQRPIRRAGPGAQHLQHLSAQALLNLGATAQQIHSHPRGTGGGFVTRQKQDTHLIEQMLAAEAGTSFRIAGFGQSRQQVARGGGSGGVQAGIDRSGKPGAYGRGNRSKRSISALPARF